VKKTESLFDKAGKISQKILDENPEHPGALHYLIHSYDSPDRAYKAKEAADKYAKAAPDAAHALHMPSHIYLALGEWDNVVTSNIESWNASVTGKQKMSRKELGYHSLSWLQYGLLQRGEHELAKRLVQDMIYYASKDNSSLARTYFVAMKGTHLSATNEWDDGIANAQTKTYDLHLTKRSGHKFLEGMQAYYKKDKKTLKEVMKSIAGDKYRSSLDLGDQTLVMCNTAGNPAIPPNQMDIDIVSILEYELQSRLYKLEGNTSEELAVLKKGTELYNQLNMSFGPPVIFIPIHEMYAESLLDQKMYKEALEVADNGLKTTPRKLKLLQMKLQAATALENGKIIQEVQELITNQTSEKVRGEVLKF